MDKLNAMATFIQIADRGSLTAAAEHLGTSLPTVVRTLAALEETLGVRLMNRTTRKVTLTDEGRHYLERCRSILSDIEDAELALSDRQSEPKGKLNVTAPIRFGTMHVRPIVTAFMKQYEQIRVELLFLDRTVNMIEEGVDVAVRIGHLEDSTMVARQVGEIRQVLCASPELVRETGTLKHPEDLSRHRCVRATGLAPGATWRFHSNGKLRAVPVNDTLVCNQIEAAVDACTAGIGFGVFLSYQVESRVREGKLVYCLSDYEPPPIPVSVVYTRAHLMSTRVRTFVDWICRDLKQVLQA